MPLPNPILKDPEIERNFRSLDRQIEERVAALAAVYRTLLFGFTTLGPDEPADTHMFGHRGVNSTRGATNLFTGINLVGTDRVAAVSMIRYEAADYALANRKTKLRLRVQIGTNGTVPAITFTTGLYPLDFAGAADVLTPSVGTVITGSTVAISSPVANGVTEADSGDFTPPADGDYGFAVVCGAALTNNAAVEIAAHLQLRHV